MENNDVIAIRHDIKNGIPLLEVFPTKYEKKALPTVIFYHGWTNHKAEVLVNGYALAKRNIRCIIPDAIYHDERQDEKPTEDHYLDFWKIVTESVKEFPSLRDSYVSSGLALPNKFGVTGLSMGGITTCMLLTTYNNDLIQAGVCLMGAPNPVEFGHQILANISDLPTNTEEQLAALAPFDLSLHPEYIDNRPLHFWHGDADTMVPFANSYNFFKQIEHQPYAENVTFSISKGGIHRVPYLASEEMAEYFEEAFLD